MHVLVDLNQNFVSLHFVFECPRHNRWRLFARLNFELVLGFNLIGRVSLNTFRPDSVVSRGHRPLISAGRRLSGHQTIAFFVLVSCNVGADSKITYSRKGSRHLIAACGRWIAQNLFWDTYCLSVLDFQSALLLAPELLVSEMSSHFILVELRFNRPHYFLNIADIIIEIVAFLQNCSRNGDFGQHHFIRIFLAHLQIKEQLWREVLFGKNLGNIFRLRDSTNKSPNSDAFCWSRLQKLHSGRVLLFGHRTQSSNTRRRVSHSDWANLRFNRLRLDLVFSHLYFVQIQIRFLFHY